MWIGINSKMKKLGALTIAVVTKDRPVRLGRCLESICRQTILPTTVLVVDNDIMASAKPVSLKFKNKLNINYVLEKKPGVAGARNTALKHSATRFLGFVDDDCVLDQEWAEAGITKLTTTKELTYVTGNTQLYNNSNLLAQAQHCRDSYWYREKLKSNNKTMEYHVDTKNIMFNLEKVFANKLEFDSHCSLGIYDSADLDFGLQLARKSLGGLYLDNMRLRHEEVSSLGRFVVRAYQRGRLAGYINHKWQLGHRLVDLSEKSMIRWGKNFIKHFAEEQRRYTDGLKLPVVKKNLILLFIKVYERTYLQGYLAYLKTNNTP